VWLCYHAFNSINRHQFGCNEIVALQEIQEIRAAMFSSPVSFGSPMESISGREYYDPNALFRTPTKKPDDDEPLLGKPSRHQSAVANRTHTYAPTIYDADAMLVPKVLEF